MNPNRRGLIKSSIAITFLTVSKASAQTSAQTHKTIGVVTTIKLKKTDEEWLCFKAGLENDGWPETGGGPKQVILPNPKEAQGQYGGSHNTTVLKGLIAGHGGVDLIAAVGGVISSVAASQQLTNIPYVYLSGMAPTTPPSVAGKYCGVILNTPAQYANARQTLVSPADIGDVWLVMNFNSGMTELVPVV